MSHLQTVAPSVQRSRTASVLATGLVVLAALPVVAFYAGRILDPLPLYAIDEGSYLIRTLYAARMAADATLQPNVGEVTNSVYFAILRAVIAVAEPDLPWIRTASLAAYVEGLVLTWLAIRPRLSGGQAWGYLLLALLFPYYRFVVTAMPEGWYVAIFGLIVWVTARLYDRRPIAHAALAGLLAAALSLVKPHGIAVAAALAVLPVIDALAGDRRWKLAVARLGVFAVTYPAVGNLVQALFHQQNPSPLLFFQAPYYSGVLGAPLSPNAWPLTLIVAAGAMGAVAMFAGPPIVAGLARLGGRWRADRRLVPEPWERAFMLVALAFAATLAMTLVFTFGATFYEGEILRIWGRYFEFFVPLAWLAAAPAIVAAEAEGRHRWRITACGLALAGLVALLFAFHKGVVLFPWDSTALTAFYRPDAARFALPTSFPFRTLAAVAMASVALALLTPLASVRIWQGGFLALALLSMGSDKLFVDTADIGRQALRRDLEAAKTIVARRPGRLFAIADDGNIDRIVFIELHGRPHMRIAAPLEPISAVDAGINQTIVVQGRHPIQGAPWRPLYVGQMISVYGNPTGP